MIKRILGEGFRVFFLSAALYGIFTGVIWGVWLWAQETGAGAPLSRAADPYMWHAHEMIFGYSGAALGGFFLTAVPNWTNTSAARRGFLTLAAGLWLAGRLAMWFSGVLPPLMVAVFDLAFVPVLAFKIASQLIKRPKPQNMMFVAILSVLWIADLMTHLEWSGVTTNTALSGLRAGLFSLVAMIVILGGRITPAFTRNAMNRAGLPETAWPVSRAPVERAAIALALALPVAALLPLPRVTPALIALLLGLAQAVRLSGWRAGWAWSQPILFALHLAQAMMALGLLLWGAAGLGIGQEIAALHVVGIGGVGGMTLAVMSRATLGHSGRALVAPPLVALAYGLMPLTALGRWAVGLLSPVAYFPLMGGLSLLWATGFIAFILQLWPALTRPRVNQANN